MTAALVDNLGVEAPGGGRTFPTSEAMAAADEAFYKERHPSRLPAAPT